MAAVVRRCFRTLSPGSRPSARWTGIPTRQTPLRSMSNLVVDYLRLHHRLRGIWSVLPFSGDICMIWHISILSAGAHAR